MSAAKKTKTNPSPIDPPPPPPKRSMEDIKAEARAFALSSSSSSSSSNHHTKQPQPPQPQRPGMALLLRKAAAAVPSVTTTTSRKRRAATISGNHHHHHHEDSFHRVISTALLAAPPTTHHRHHSIRTAAAVTHPIHPHHEPDNEEDDEEAEEENDDEYAQFVKILSTLDDHDKLQALVTADNDNDDEEEFLLELEEEEDDEEEELEGCEDDKDNHVGDDTHRTKHPPDPDDDHHHHPEHHQPHPDHHSAIISTYPMESIDTTSHSQMESLPDVNDSFYRELEEELGWLEEEDIEAAVATLLDYPVSTATPLGTSRGGTPEDDNAPLHPNHRHESEPTHRTPSIPDLRDDDDQHMNHMDTMVEANHPSSNLTPAASTTSPYRNSGTNYHHHHHHHRTIMTPDQEEQLRTLLQKHHQLLLQQAVLAVRAANAQRRNRYASTTTTPTSNSSHHHHHPTSPDGPDAGTSTTTTHSLFSEFAHCNETADDIAEILDSAVGMLLDLDENRKDAIRYQIQCESSSTFPDIGTTLVDPYHHHPTTIPSLGTASSVHASLSPQRSLYAEFFHDPPSSTILTKTAATTTGSRSSSTSMIDRRLTRAQFSKKLLEQSVSFDRVKTVFNVRGLHKLMPTFNLLDRCAEGKHKGDNNVLEIETNQSACEQILNFSEASIDPNLIPGCRDLSENFVDAKEIFDHDFTAPCTPAQESILRKNRNFFTAGEDNLVLRGVNLYGEKQWVLIADRFLPERSVNIISQRYSKLSYMLFKANGIKIDKNGNLPNPPKLESIDDLDKEQLSSLQKVQPPAILNVHRWSMEEDLTLLKAVAMMGSMWAEVRARYIPHRDRGHLRKRYQVLERRIKATSGRIKKHEKIMITKMRSPMSTQPAAPHLAIHFSNYPTVPTDSNTEPAIPRTSTTTTKAQSVTTAKKSNQSTQSRSDHPSEPKQQKPSTASTNSNQKQDSQRTAVPQYPVPPPYYHPPYPYVYHPPPPPGSYIPYMPPPYGYYPPYYHPAPGHYDEGSRAGYEQLIAESNRGWSQMPHMESMLESETEVASTIITQLAKSPAKPPAIGEVVDDSEPDASPHTERRDSIMASVKVAKSPAKRMLNFAGDKRDTENVSQATSPPYSTGQSYPLYGSPAIPMPDPSPGIRPVLFSPDETFKIDDRGLESCLQGSPPFLYTQAENSQNSHSLNGYDLNGPFHNTDTGSRDVPADTPSNLFNDTPDNSRLVDPETHLLDTDLEAVSALNLLRSPSKFIASKREDSDHVNVSTKKSLFATVVGNLDENKKGKTGARARNVKK